MNLSGQVQLFEIGNAKKYLLSSALPSHSLYDITSNLIIILDQTFSILHVNPAVCQLCRVTRDQVIGKPVTALHLDLFQSMNIRTLLKQVQSEDLYCHVLEIREGQEQKFLEITLTRGQTLHNRVAISLVIRDVTARKKREDEIRFHSAIVDSSDDAIVGINRDLLINVWNRGAERLFGYTVGEALGRTVNLLYPDGYEEIISIHERLLKGEMVPPFHGRRRRRDGSLVDVSINVSLVHNGSGEVIGSAAIYRIIPAGTL
jgi:PAS domain S-box-containing protein